MALSLKDAATDRLAREVAKLTGESLTEAVRTALAERLERERHKRGRGKSLAERLNKIARHCASLPDYDTRTPDEIIGYDDKGHVVMVIDTSAIVAILENEPQGQVSSA